MFKFIFNWLKKLRISSSVNSVSEKNNSSLNFQIPKQVHLHWHVNDISQIPQNVIWNAGRLVTVDVLPVENSARVLDRELFDRVRMQWQFGEWETLTYVDFHTLEHHPDRAKIALVIACAWLQRNDSSQARKFTRHAKEWGCDKKLMAQLLIAGVHNTLGRVASLNHDENRAKAYFQLAVKGVSGDSKLASQVRMRCELGNLGSLSQSHKITSSKQEPKTIDSEQTNTISEPYKGIVSYAQNFEDVMLWRALHHVKNGFYIDVGAQDPITDSVSKAFYENGWRGIHVEPTSHYAELLRQDRPDETVLEVALSNDHGEIVFFEIPETGMSTGILSIAQSHQQKGFHIREIIVPCMTLADVFNKAEGRDIHWLKIDAEGMEQSILESWGDSMIRPWIIIVESVTPLSQIEFSYKWEHLLLKRDYQPAYFDGLNRFYISTYHSNLIELFNYGPSIFDNFTLSGKGGGYSSLIDAKYNQREQKMIEEINRLKSELDSYKI